MHGHSTFCVRLTGMSGQIRPRHTAPRVIPADQAAFHGTHGCSATRAPLTFWQPDPSRRRVESLASPWMMCPITGTVHPAANHDYTGRALTNGEIHGYFLIKYLDIPYYTDIIRWDPMPLCPGVFSRASSACTASGGYIQRRLL